MNYTRRNFIIAFILDVLIIGLFIKIFNADLKIDSTTSFILGIMAAFLVVEVYAFINYIGYIDRNSYKRLIIHQTIIVSLNCVAVLLALNNIKSLNGTHVFMYGFAKIILIVFLITTYEFIEDKIYEIRNR